MFDYSITANDDSDKSPFSRRGSNSFLTLQSMPHSNAKQPQNARLHAVRTENVKTRERVPIERFGCLYGSSAPMKEVYALIRRVAPSDASVLIVGENGCGKELVAKTIHEMSSRASRPFLAVNCGALPATLIEAELFGYEKGAFTGANKTHCGFFERAHGGTLLLDEITEMPLELQVRLLRVLETRRVSRLGGDREIECEVRILAATNRDPMTAVSRNQLREDLLYRLVEFPITLPPLRERGDDVSLLARHFLHTINLHYGTHKRFADNIDEKLYQHSWPGNVRELKNWVQRAYLMADEVISDDMLNPFKCQKPAAGSSQTLQFEVGTSLEQVERQFILATLERFRGNKRQAAEALGISLKTIYNKLNAYLADGSYSERNLYDSLR